MAGRRVALVMPTFWDVIAPPLSIVALKSYLEQFGHQVWTENLNTAPELWNTQGRYLGELKEFVPEPSLLPRLGSELIGLHMNAAVFKEDAPDVYPDYIEALLRDHFPPYFENLPPSRLGPLVSALDAIVFEHFERVRQRVPALLASNPEFVGCTALSSTLGTGLFLLREVKREAPGIVTLLGGPGPYNGIGRDSPDMRRLEEKCTFVDKIVFGEGELVLRRFLEEGHQGAKVISASDFGLGPIEMDTLPPLDYTGLNTGAYFNLSVGASRGCPFKCAFCSETKTWGAFRKMSVPRLVEEVERLSRKHGTRQFFFADALMNHSITPFTEALIQRGIEIEFDCYLRAEKHAQDPERVARWARGGLRRARIGMESASPRILKIMDKGITPEQQAGTLRCLRRAGVKTTTYWIAGHPHETEEDFQQTLDFIGENKGNVYEADLAVFYFYGEGEVGSDDFIREQGGVTERFGPEFEPLSIFRYFKLKDLNPSKEVAFQRAICFAESMRKMGVPCNRSTPLDYLSAERRWRALGASSAA